MTKVIQIAAASAVDDTMLFDSLYALGDDGSVWEYASAGDGAHRWRELPRVPFRDNADEFGRRKTA